MVRRRHDDHVARQVVDLQKQGADYPLDLPRLVRISPFLTESVEFIEEKYTGPGTDMVEEAAEPAGRFAQVASDDTFVTDDEERYEEGVRQGMGQ